jgi:hypothetical protein
VLQNKFLNFAYLEGTGIFNIEFLCSFFPQLIGPRAFRSVDKFYLFYGFGDELDRKGTIKAEFQNLNCPILHLILKQFFLCAK